MSSVLRRAISVAGRLCAASGRQRRAFALLTAVMLCVAAPCVTYAQLGGLMEKAKGRAIQILMDGTMKEIEKKIAEAVAKHPISEEAKADITKKLTEMARPIVKKFIDGAASGKLPNPMELAQTVLKDILPQIPGLVAAAKSAQPAAPTPQQAPQPEMRAQQPAPPQETPQAAAAPVQPEQPEPDNPKVAVYAVGAKDASVNRAMAMRLAIALANSGRYQVSENYLEFFDKSSAESKDIAAAVDSGRLRRTGELFGVDYVCAAEIVSVFGEDRTFARVLNVETAEVAASGVSDRPLKTLADLTAASEQLVEAMFKKELPAAAPPPETPCVSQPCEQPAPCVGSADGFEAGAESERKFKTGFALGYGFSGDAVILQLGGVHIHPITEEVVSLVVEANLWLGSGYNSGGGYYYDIRTGRYSAREEAISFSGVNIPALFRFEKSVVFSEAGLFLDALSGKAELTGKDAWIFNVGVALGGGFSFSKGYTHYFYRFSYGTAYYSHTIGIRQLF